MEQTKREILISAATRLFSEKGYDAVGIQEIVDAAEVTKPTLYYYFSSKQGLLDAVCRNHFEPLLRALEATAAGYSGDLAKVLVDLATVFSRYGLDHRASASLQLSCTYLPATHAASSVISPFMERFRGVFRDLFVRSVPEHGNLRGHEELLALILTGTLNNFLLHQLYSGKNGGQWSPEAVIKQYMYGIYSL